MIKTHGDMVRAMEFLDYYKKVISRNSFFAHIKTGIEREDLIQIGCETLLTKCKKRWPEEKNSLIIYHSMLDYAKTIKGTSKKCFTCHVKENLSIEPTQEARFIFIEAIESLSPEAKEVVYIALSEMNQIRLKSKSAAPKIMRGELKRLLTKRKWSDWKIIKALSEIKTLLNEM